MSEHDEIVVAALTSVPEFNDVAAKDCKITRLGGLTNLVHLVEVGDRKIIVRIPGEGTEEYIDRRVEIANAKAAFNAGVSAEVIWADAASGIMISNAIENIETMTPELFKTRKGSPARAGKALAKLHGSGEKFEFRFELFSMIDDYLKILATRDVELPEGYHDIVKAARPVQQALATHPAALSPCHCDPLCENFLDDGEKMWIVDWEYSGINDPLWDVGDLAVEAAMNDAQQQEFLRAYFGKNPSPAEFGRVVVYKAMCDLLWTLWGLIQHADKNPADDFWAYANARFERCKALMNDAAFAGHVGAVRKGG